MFKKITTFLFIFLFIFFSSYSYATNYAYWATSLTGGGTGSLDSIDGANLNDGDMAIVVTSVGYSYFYRLNAASGASESSPDVIAPDNNAGTKRWILMGVNANDGEFNTLSAGSIDVTSTEADFNSSELKEVKFKLCNKTSSAASASGTADTYGSAVTISPITGYYGILLQGAVLSCTAITGGTTLTVRLTANYDDSTTASVTHDFTTTGDYTLTDSEIRSLIKDSVAITSFSVDVKSTGTGTTTDQGTATVVGRYL